MDMDNVCFYSSIYEMRHLKRENMGFKTLDSTLMVWSVMTSYSAAWGFTSTTTTIFRSLLKLFKIMLYYFQFCFFYSHSLYQKLL